MKAHWLNDGESVLVTGTQDVEQAKVFVGKCGEEDMDDFARSETVTGRATQGYIVPQHPEAEYQWMWYEKTGARVKAVIFE